MNRFSEYAGVPYEKQKSMIEEGKKILEEKGIRTDIFMAPGHTFDRNTLKALRECGFGYLTDGFGKAPYSREGLTFLPISSRKKDCFKDREGYTTLVIHANGMSEAEISWYERMLAEYPGSVYFLWSAADASCHKTRFCRKSCRIYTGFLQTDPGEAAFLNGVRL